VKEHKKFWLGFGVGYGLAIVIPPMKLLGAFRGKSGA